MKKNKIMFLILTTVLIMAVVGCSPNDTKFRNMETRLKYNDKDSGWLDNDTNRLNTNLNNGMTRRNMDLNNDGWDNNTNLNNPKLRNNTNLDSGRMDNNNSNNSLTNNVNNMSTNANKIAKRVAALKEVNNASVVINGDTAIVGIESNMKNNNISSNLKQKIEAAVKAGDKNIKNIKITSDSDITNRLKTMTTQLNEGNPISEFTRDIEDILERIANPRR